MEQVITEKIEKGDILFVPATGFLSAPAFFEVRSKSTRGSICLRTLGTEQDDDGGYVPSDTAYHDSIYEYDSRNGREYVSTWCGKAYAWDGIPC